MSSSLLFKPLKVGNVTLQHRVVMAPLTRYRSTKKAHVPHDFVKTYYGQRASTPGTFLITEATLIAPQAGGYDHVPGIWSDDQIAAWRKVTDEVHSKGSFIYLQLWALGRAAYPSNLESEGLPYVSSSPTPLTEKKPAVPRELTIPEIEEYAKLYAQAAENAVVKAGFDGVEVHGANGYLVDQFLKDVVNKRTDKYGGSIENRSRFGLEVIQAVVDRVGAERTAIRLSPHSNFQEMKMVDPKPQFTHFISELASRHPTLSYIHLIEGRADEGVENVQETLDFAIDAWRPTGQPFFMAGGLTRENALAIMEREGMDNVALVFGRWFLANPDLPRRLRENIPLNAYDRQTFYTPEEPKGYIDYPFAT